MSQRILQIATLLIGGLTVALAAMSLLMGGKSPVYGSASIPQIPTLDSNLRFFGGIGLGLGLILLYTVPGIEEKSTLFRAAWLCAFLGGLGRLISIPIVGAPATPIVAFAVIEVLGAPVFVTWQKRLADGV